jgi:hypothetical protein
MIILYGTIQHDTILNLCFNHNVSDFFFKTARYATLQGLDMTRYDVRAQHDMTWHDMKTRIMGF